MDVKQMTTLPEGLEVGEIGMVDEMLSITVVSTQLCPTCPLCGTPSTRVHSHYARCVADLPCAGRTVRLLLHVRKCFCQVPTCERHIFAERLNLFIEPWARVTQRLFQVVQAIGLATGGRLGVRLTNRLGITTSRLTILRRIMALPTAPIGEVIEVGIDDFSFRRGHTFGTILVDLRTRQVLDLLPDRTVDTSASWLSHHSEIELVSRDRGGDYASAAKASAPQAIQCADRFHLLRNLGRAVEGVLARHLAAHRKQRTETTRAVPTSTEDSSKSSPKKVALSQAKREERFAQYEQVIALREQGYSQITIAEQVGVGRSTVSRWLLNGTFPEQQPRPRKTRVDAHLPHLIEQWETGCYTVAQLHRELVANGYSHSYDSVYRQLIRTLPAKQKRQYVRTPSQEGKKQEPADRLSRPPVLAREAMFLFLHRPNELSVEEQETLTRLRSLHSEVDQAYEFVQQFARMVRTRTGQQLDEWLCRVKESRIRELQGFVAGVIRDKGAVVAGLTLPQSNGLVEGKVNKLKLIKRMGYGRAEFPLLRQRVLHAL